MAKYTSKLNLKKPEANDFYNVNDSNKNFDKIDEFASRTDNPHSVTKAQVGLGNVDNTSDKDKPISTAQATAINEAKQAGTNAKTSIDNHIANKSNPHNVTADLVKASKMFTYSEINSYTTVLDACNALKYGGGFVASSFSKIANASDYPKKGYEFVFSVVCESNEARKTVIAYLYHGGRMNIYQRNIFDGAWETTWNSTDESYYGEHNFPYPAQIQTGSYVGTGLYGSANPCRLEFSFVPKYVLVEAYYDHVLGNIASPTDYRLELFNGVTETVSHSFRDGKDVLITIMKVSWAGNAVEWYWRTTSNTTNAEYHQLNGAITYRYIAIG